MSVGKYKSFYDLLDKAEWEGGLIEMVCNYGLKSEQLPDDAPEGFAEAIDSLNHYAVEVVRLANKWEEENE